ncbi:hypothetical protein [Micromonospora sp. L31]|uniref:hypothetical protein n=1 Tax=Micromonospora sp. L31 TaxID=3452213 RepID=UPI003F88937A
MTAATSALPLKELRTARGWTQAKVLVLLEATAARRKVSLPERSALKTMLSRWENGARTSPLYTDLLCQVFDLPAPPPAAPVADVAIYRSTRCRNSRIYGRVFADNHGWWKTTRTAVAQ